MWLRAVTYGPFPGGWPESFDPDFARIAAAGFNSVRIYEMPGRRMLDAAARHGLSVFGGLKWRQNADFLGASGLWAAARVMLADSLRGVADHPAMAGVYVGNEIPADLVRWMGPARVRRVIEDLVSVGRDSAPWLLFAYANYPSTEYLEPDNADFTAFNIYLEREDTLKSYLKRLHHIAGDRPLVVSEFGLDSRRNGPGRQAELLSHAMEIASAEECAGLTVYAWSDRWWNAGAEVLDWDFGLTGRDGSDKPALAALAALAATPAGSPPASRAFSVIICTHNGRARIAECLDAVLQSPAAAETIVVDDGSDDGTADLVASRFPQVKLLRLDRCGLSAARNAGAAAAGSDWIVFTDDDCVPDAEWLARLDRVLADGRHAAAGGPNLPPPPRTWREAVICAAPGAPGHVMIDDEQADHLPGCNLAVRKTAFFEIGGFDPVFRTAGDDVDFCWRLREAGHRLGFSPGAFVWHRRRPSLRAYLRQQAGYGAAERLLMRKFPERFTKHGTAKWAGFVYGGGPVRVDEESVIYHGLMGSAGYQPLVSRMPPLRGIDRRFDGWRTRCTLRVVSFLAARLRDWMRNRTWLPPAMRVMKAGGSGPEVLEWRLGPVSRGGLLDRLLGEGWQPCGPTAVWDLEKDGTLLLFATESGDDGSSDTLMRLHGDTGMLPEWLHPWAMNRETRKTTQPD